VVPASLPAIVLVLTSDLQLKCAIASMEMLLLKSTHQKVYNA
jgi:hypothetical protein